MSQGFIFRFLFWCVLSGFYGTTQAQCSGAFSSDSTTCKGGRLSFQANDTAGSRQYQWNFGDILSGTDNEDTARNPSHLFLENGSFTVTLIVSDTGGCSDTFSKTLRVFDNPKAQFTWTNACANLLTAFNNTSQADSNDAISTWSWNFGNASSSNAQHPQTNYAANGTYTVSLIAASASGCADTSVQTVTVYKQPVASRNPAEVCLNGQVNFQADTISTATAFHWDFGDSSFFTQRTISHIYSKKGTMFPKLTVDFGTTKCKVEIDSVVVNDLPDPDFFIPSDTQCFAYNKVCVQLLATGQKIKTRNVIFDDGFVDDTTSLNNTTVCHKYTDFVGGTYSITVELIDSNNCFASKTLNNAVVIHPEIAASFTLPFANGCFKTSIRITNTSNQSPPKVDKFMWDFGDGSKDSSNWTNLNYTYVADGRFNISLAIKNTDGCADTFVASQVVQNTNFVIDATIDSSAGYCRNNNYFLFRQTPISNASIEWFVRPGSSLYNFTSAWRYVDPGVYYPYVTISKNGCDSTYKLDSIVIFGPRALFGNVLNQFQCQIKDTVYFENQSVLFRNQNVTAFWDAGDPFSSACTLSTKEGINIGQNCRYSKDSLNFKHMYQKGQEACYYAKLVVIDTVVGCRDSINAILPLMPPKAKGLFIPSDSTPCPGPEGYKRLIFNINIPQPTCLKYAWWVMWDSLAAEKSGNFDSFWLRNSNGYNYSYNNYAGDSNGRVSIGLIVENGLDTNGRVCRDTGWFHSVVRVAQMSPMFTSDYDSSQYYCKNSTFHFFLADSTQDSATQFIWNFGDGNSVSTTDPKYQSHTFKNAGSYEVRLRVINPNGCIGDTSLWVNVGVQKGFVTTSKIECTNDTFRIAEYNRYSDRFGWYTAFWSDPNRASQGKEQILYDMGDGNGFQDIGPNPVWSYPHPGDYLISMAVKDSVGCWDTLPNYIPVKVSGIYAGFILPADTILCAQTLKLLSAATVVDSTVMRSMTGDRVTNWEWNFGAAYPKSFIRDPQRYFATGNYQIQLKATNTFGCSDSISKAMVIIGPRSNYTITSDTIGCEPLRIAFQNNSTNATDYIWQFGDNLKSSFATQEDTNVSFQYAGHGTFYPLLVARGTFTKNGVTQTCADVFPDTSLGIFKSVIVWELPKPDFTWNTNCATGTTRFQNTSALSTGTIVSRQWFFGDGGNSTDSSPVHHYADTGQYRVVLKVFTDHGCEDSIVRNIMISPTPLANFGYNFNCQGTNSLFRDSTFAFNDRIYLWRWDFGDGTTSTVRNPSHLYTLDTTYTVKLHVTNVAGCADSVAKNITVFSRPKPDFNFSNVCDEDSVNIQNTSTSKQSIVYWRWEFGNSDSDTIWEGKYRYAIAGSYNLKLVLRTAYNCMDSLTRAVVVHPNPLAKIAINDTAQCFRYHHFSFSDSSTIISGTTTRKWNLGDLTTSDSANTNHRYSNFGKYHIQLIAISNFGCDDTATDSVQVFPMPRANFVLMPPDQCAKYNSFLFSDSGNIPTGNYTIKWEFGNGDTSLTEPVTYHYSDTGKYFPLQILTSDKNCSDSFSSIVNIWPMPQVAFAIADSTLCLKGNNFLFSNNSTIGSGSMQYQWQFGDGNGDTSTNTSHAYNNHGPYQVLLIARSDKGCIDTSNKNIVVFPMPKAAFKIQDSLQCFTGNSFVFTNNTSIAYGTNTFLWEFGDNNTSSTSNPTHSYNAYGNYTVKLVATSAETCIDSISQPVVVYPMPNVKLLVNSTENCINSQNFIFYDSSDIAYGTLSRIWKFGDSTTSFSDNPSKTFLYPKIYRIWLTELSDNNCADSAYRDITVFPKPYPGFSINDSTQCFRGNNFNFASTSNIGSGTMNYTWKLGDGNTKTGANISHSYSNFGNWQVTLIPQSDKGCMDSVTLRVEVYPMPAALFSENDSNQCLRQNQFVFSNNSNIANGNMTYRWNFGDTNTSSTNSPVHIYANHGTYTTTLIATSGFNCRDTFSRSLEVFPMPVVGYRVNDSDQCFNKQNFVFTDTSSIFSGSILRTWQTDDNNTSGNAVFTHSFATDTTHWVKLVQISNHNCADSITRNVVVFSSPVAQFRTNDSSQCQRQNQFAFANTSTLKKDTMAFLWQFGDLADTIGVHANHRYAAWGTYAVHLIATSQNACVDTAIASVEVNPMPQVLFAANDTGQCINDQNFIFTNSSYVARGNISHFWQFGDGDTSTILNPLKVYAYDTTYRVWLSETSDKGCADSLSMLIDVYPKPEIIFSTNDTIQCLRQNLYVTANNSRIKYGILQYLWNFGDGNTDTNKNTTHSYTNSGDFVLQLRATSDRGCKDSGNIPLTIGAMPVPAYTINDAGQCFNDQNFVFTNNSTLQTGSFRSHWKLGDGSTDTLLNSNHVYNNFGQFRVRYIATTNFGCQDSIDKLLWVYPNANAAFSTNDSDQCRNQQNYIFTNTSSVATGNIRSIFWDLGNGNTATAQQVKSYYPNSGTYRISIYTTTDSGCTDSFSNLIRVYPKPASSFTVNDSAQCLFQNNYTFTDISFDSFGVNQYFWNINGEQTQTSKIATYKFKSSGYKTISLISTSLRGCSDTSQKLVYVKPMPDPSFEKLPAYYCELTGPYALLPVTAGGTYYGKNIQNQLYTPVILWKDTVKYIVTVNGCTDSSSQITQVYPGPKVDLGNDTTLCKFEFLTLKINSWQSQYTWNTGNNSSEIRITQPGFYKVTVSNICGVKSDSITVKFRDINCRFFLPNAFTPNKDGVNDVYKPVVFDLDEMEYSIYNRWGELVYRGNLQSPGWDGQYMGALAQDGVYIIYVNYKYSNGATSREQFTESASFHLLR